MTANTLDRSVPVRNLKRITAYVQPDIYQILEDWANEDSRTLSNLVGVIVSKAAQERHSKGKENDQQT